jgi:hypothetical protein
MAKELNNESLSAISTHYASKEADHFSNTESALVAALMTRCFREGEGGERKVRRGAAKISPFAGPLWAPPWHAGSDPLMCRSLFVLDSLLSRQAMTKSKKVSRREENKKSKRKIHRKR